ncbi:MAG: sugar ABC transporter permease [Clostridia bacterium]|nr:sugar ABC transporter permease [Clostridia bacterium]
MKNSRIGYSTQRKLLGFTFLIPFLLGFLMFFALPLVNTIIYSFHFITVDDLGAMKLDPVGVKNYIDLFTVEVSTRSQQILRVLVDENTNMLVNMPLITLFSLFLALLANRQFKGRAVVRMIFFLPIILGLDVVTEMLTVTTGSDWVAAGGGLFAQSLVARLLIRYTSIPPMYLNPLIEFVENIFSIISRSGVQTLVFLAALQSISPSMYEVAKIEGATAYETFWKVTIPSILHILLFVVIYTVVDLFLTSQIAQEAYSFAFEKNKIGIGSALSVVYILNVLLVLGLVLLLTRKAVSKNGK